MRILEHPERGTACVGATDRAALSAAAGLLAAALTAWPATPARAEPMQLSDGPGGVTCRHYSVAGKLAWQRRLGDWADAAGEAWGERPYASAEIRPVKGGQPVSLDVTALARQWLAGEHPNTGIFLRAVGGNGSVLFYSRESTDPGMQPVLELEWADGARDRLAPVTDTFLDCSTHRSSGSSKVVRVGHDQTTLLVFKLPSARERRLKSAQLRLNTFKQYAKGITVGVFRPTPAWALARQEAEQGVAARYKGDRDISSDPAVITAVGFEDDGWRKEWRRLTNTGFYEVVSEDPENGFVPFAGSALKTTLKKGENTALNLRYLFERQTGSEPEEVYFRYYLRFGEDWSPDLDGGKLPGIAGTYGTGGWGMRRSDGTNGWSVRGLFSRMTVSPFGGRATPIGSYVYHADMKGHSGNHWGWNLGPSGLLRNNKWYSVEQHVKLNTPGQRDGTFRAWIDGQLVYERNGLGFRDIESIRIESIWLNVYHGGTRPSPRDMSLYIDNLVVANRYIGPMVP